MSALIARLDVDQVDWVGTSLGGHIGMEIAALSGTPIRRLVLNDFGARVGAAALQRISSYVINGGRLRFATLDEAEAHLRKIFAPFGALTDEQWRHMVEHTAVDAGDGLLRLNYDPAISKQFWWPIMLDITLWHVWDKVTCPTLLIHGQHSDLLSAHTVRDMQRRGKAAAKGLVSTAEIAECGHAPALMDDHQIALIENFLTAEGAGSAAVERQRSAGAA
jgi:pimeloyl-ACP methyl ester carboxylesterase